MIFSLIKLIVFIFISFTVVFILNKNENAKLIRQDYEEWLEVEISRFVNWIKSKNINLNFLNN